MKLTPSSQSPSDQTPLYFTGETDPPSLLPRKIWSDFYQSLLSNHGKTLIWAFLTFFLSGILLSVDYWVPSQIVENDISTQDVYAPYTIEVKDAEETLGAQKQARKDTLPVYKSVQSINQSVRDAIGGTFQGIQELKLNTRKSYAEKKAEFIALIGQVDGADAMADKVLQNITVSQLESIQHLTQITAEHLLQEGLSENDYVERRSLVIMKAMPQAGYSPIEIEVAQFFTHLMIKPNLYIDNEAWSKAKEDAAKKVKPFYKTFRKGQKIVGRGEMVTPLKNQALSEIGKTPKGVNFTGALGVLLLTLIFTGTLWGYLYNYESRDYFKPQFSSLLCTLTVSSLFMVKLAQQNEWPLLAIPLACYALLVSIFTHPR
ncbi:MAG: hypothetical protein K2X66_17970, partial [Cyanobacteria bacterium]|nr:hypothetical protein [Cyanobacteriota bacterium]